MRVLKVLLMIGATCGLAGCATTMARHPASSAASVHSLGSTYICDQGATSTSGCKQVN